MLGLIWTQLACKGQQKSSKLAASGQRVQILACTKAQYTVKFRYLEVDGTFFLQVQITRSANLFALRVIWTCIRVIQVRDIEIRL